MTEFTMSILSNWILAGYNFVLYTRIKETQATLRPLKNDIPEELLSRYQLPCYTLPIGDDQVLELAHGIIMFDENLPFTVFCDVSDIE